ncbi:MAG: hypothetical protein JRE14_02655 [Deltaproteobacteria bacterium]|nr:hypothetical protein [Deltaproteobacteria bacterium]
MMKIISYALIALSCLAFVIAALGSVLNFDFLGVDPKGFSRACNNLILIAIALALCFKTESK